MYNYGTPNYVLWHLNIVIFQFILTLQYVLIYLFFRGGLSIRNVLTPFLFRIFTDKRYLWHSLLILHVYQISVKDFGVIWSNCNAQFANIHRKMIVKTVLKIIVVSKLKDPPLYIAFLHFRQYKIFMQVSIWAHSRRNDNLDRSRFVWKYRTQR